MIAFDLNNLNKMKIPAIDSKSYESGVWIFHNGYCVQNPLSSLVTYSRDINGHSFILPADITLEEPIYIIHTNESSMIRPKTYIKALENSKTTLIELYVIPNEKSTSVIEASIEITLEDHAQLNHILIPVTGSEASQTTDIQVHQSSGSQYQGTHMMLGGKINHTTANIYLNAPHAECNYAALMFGKQNEKIDTHLTIHHQKPLCYSQTLVRGVMNKRARGSFTGKIIVQEGASQTTATLENKNLLLSMNAEFNTSPQLEIYNDDLQCSHGATVGHLDLEALFYLRSRGISEKEATKMLIDGFIYPTLKNLPDDVCNYIQGYIYDN